MVSLFFLVCTLSTLLCASAAKLPVNLNDVNLIDNSSSEVISKPFKEGKPLDLANEELEENIKESPKFLFKERQADKPLDLLSEEETEDIKESPKFLFKERQADKSIDLLSEEEAEDIKQSSEVVPEGREEIQPVDLPSLILDEEAAGNVKQSSLHKRFALHLLPNRLCMDGVLLLNGECVTCDLYQMLEDEFCDDTDFQDACTEEWDKQCTFKEMYTQFEK